MNNIVICLHGPKYCGKNTAFGHMSRAIDGCGSVITEDAMAIPLERAVMGLLKGTRFAERFIAARRSTNHLIKRVRPFARELSDHSAAGLMAALSEDFLKDQMGQQVMGFLAAQRLIDWPGRRPGLHHVHFITDTGFQQEFDTFKYRVEQELGYKVVLVNITRPGTSHTGDTREPVTGDPEYGLYNPEAYIATGETYPLFTVQKGHVSFAGQCEGLMAKIMLEVAANDAY